MTELREQLKSIRTFPSLVRFLRDELDWPVETEDFEELTFDYSPEELGIDAANAAKIDEIKRLRPLIANQPWSIFFVKFEPKRLPVVALRRILAGLVVKKRATASAAEQPKWVEDDLLFISNYGEGEERQITFAHFSQPEVKSDLPTLRVLGWDNLDTPLHLDDVAEHLTHNLAWPEDDNDIEAWRRKWNAAFTLGHREIITTSRELSIRLAELARAIRHRITTALAIETEDGSLTKLMEAFRQALVHDLDEDAFADMYAQTIAYGLLSARIADPRTRTTDDFAGHMRTNPFLRELMETFLKVGGRRSEAGGQGIDFDELGVGEVVELLDHARMEAVVRDFGDRNPQEDPVIHFYELFLKEYDAKKRMQRGVFYTPRPVVSYIVRSVDELLRTEFDLEDGLADTTTWGEMASRRKGFKIPEGVRASQAFVQILDPATGTGTFLVEVIDLIHETLLGKWMGQGHTDEAIEALWNAYVPEHLLPRLCGYELLMAPYAIAHLKISLKLHETGYRFVSEERARIYLTNALEPQSDIGQQTLEGLLPALAHEAQAVNKVKDSTQFTVLIGNPPYSKSSSNRAEAAEALVAQYKRLVEGETNVQPLSDDYVKFIAFALQVSVPSASVIGMITNRSYLDGLIHRGMREELAAACSSLRVVDLHGDSNVGEDVPDGSENENVFDIKQGVAIIILVRGRAGCHAILQADLWGTREQKYLSLAKGEVQSRSRLRLSPPYFFFSPKDLDSQTEQKGWPAVNEVFDIAGMGVKSRRDQFLISKERFALEARFTELASAEDVEVLRPSLQVTDNPQWTLTRMQELVRREGVEAGVTSIVYRPFDTRFIWYHREAIERGDARWPVMKHVLPNGLSLLTSRQSANADFSAAFVARGLSEMKAAESTRGSYAFPLFAGEPDTIQEATGRPSNLRLSAFGSGLEQRSPEEVFAYIYAILHSPNYRTRYAGALRIEFPRVPPDPARALADELCQLGGELVSLHLLESSELDNAITTYRGPTAPAVGRVGWSADTVWLDAPATQRGVATAAGAVGFEGVPWAVWNFRIGGYQVCEKWLKDRKGLALSDEDIVNYQKIVVALSETIRLMTEIDEVIEERGGWPGAFAASKAAAPV